MSSSTPGSATGTPANGATTEATPDAATETTTGATTTGEGAGRPKRRRGYFLPGAIAMAALLAIGIVIGAGDLAHPAPHSLSGPDVASEIALGLQSAERLRQPPPVSCPGREPVREGLHFICTEGPATPGPNGQPPRPIAVSEIDSRGHLRWTLTPAPSSTPAPTPTTAAH